MTTAYQPQPGDIGFSHNVGGMAFFIRLGEWLRFRKGDYVNHEFVVDRVFNGVPYIIQATLRGVTDTARLVDVAPGGSYMIVVPPATIDRDKLLEFCRSQVGDEYGILTIAAIAIDLASWSWFPSFRGARKNSWICSALSNEGLRYAGWLHQWTDIYCVTPAEGLLALEAEGWQIYQFDRSEEWPHKFEQVYPELEP